MDEVEMGNCGARFLPDGAVRWRLWAPKARRAELVLIDGERRRALAMSPEPLGFFNHTEGGIAEGQRYVYRLDNGLERPDPASQWQPQGVHRPSAVLRPEKFVWSERDWSGIKREELVFYEIHTGTFTSEGTFEAIIPRLESLRELGITAIQLMPIAQFPGARNWGYDGVHLFAPQDTYGGPHGLQRLVNACHARSVAIFLDVVYNHLGPEGNYLHDFGPYFAEHYRTFWGPACNYDRAGCDAVRAFVLDNVRQWLGHYRFDGLRLDAVHAIFDISPRHILRAIKETATECAADHGRPVHVIAESDLNDVRLLLPPEQGGYGLDAQWSDDFHHTIHTHVTGERQGYYEDFGQVQHFGKVLEKTFIHDGAYSRHRGRRHGAPAGDLPGDRFVVFIQNHDQVGNRARGDRLGQLVSPSAQRLTASLLLLAPHVPLLFMGEEYGETHPFPFFCSFGDGRLIKNIREGRRREFAAFAWQGDVPDPQAESTFASARLQWSWPPETHHAGLRHLYHDLLAVRRSWPALQDFRQRAARLLPETDNAVILLLVRGGRTPQAGQTLQVYCNLTSDPQSFTPVAGLEDQCLFTSEARRYHGSRQGTHSLPSLLPYECAAFGPGHWEKLV